MNDNELLQAIKNIVDVSIQENNKVIEKNFNVIEQKLEKNNDILINQVKAVVENKYDEILKLLKEDYGRVSDGVKKVADYDKVKDQVKNHENALINHNERIAKLEKVI